MSTVGFTGTRSGMTPEQRRAVGALLAVLKPERVVHGDCIGADDDFDWLCSLRGIARGIRPCTAPDSLRAHCERNGATALALPERPMMRNRHIVDDADVMIACPPTRQRIKSGSGTWATIGFAERALRKLFVVYPDGEIDERTGRAVRP